jgi:hypothetical protein
MLELIRRIQEHSPAGSILIVEADEQFDFEAVRGISPANSRWDERSYPPAVIGIWRSP